RARRSRLLLRVQCFASEPQAPRSHDSADTSRGVTGRLKPPPPRRKVRLRGLQSSDRTLPSNPIQTGRKREMPATVVGESRAQQATPLQRLGGSEFIRPATPVRPG